MQFVPFCSFLLRHLDKKYGLKKATDVISMSIVHKAASNSFKDGSTAERQKWCNKLSDSWFNLQQDWFKTRLLEPDWKDKSIKIAEVTIADLLQIAILQTDEACL